jgi:PASTA domain
VWERLVAWAPAGPASPAGDGDGEDGARALAALADVGLLRKVLDQVELSAVRAARARAKSWSEIATMLGVSRQSAWERWRDLDDAVEPAPVGAGSTELSADAARDSRRRSSVVVPDVVGRSWADASEQLRGKRLVPVGVGPGGSASDATVPEWPDSVITDQSPESGAKVPPDSLVRLWFERGGGGAGVREPRRPKPDPLTAREERYETSDEAVG